MASPTYYVDLEESLLPQNKFSFADLALAREFIRAVQRIMVLGYGDKELKVTLISRYPDGTVRPLKPFTGR